MESHALSRANGRELSSANRERLTYDPVKNIQKGCPVIPSAGNRVPERPSLLPGVRARHSGRKIHLRAGDMWLPHVEAIMNTGACDWRKETTGVSSNSTVLWNVTSI